MTRAFLFILATLVGTVFFSLIVIMISWGIVKLLEINPDGPIYERYPEFLGSLIFLGICLPLVKKRNLDLKKHALISFTFGGTILTLLLLYPKIKSERKADLFNKWSMIFGFVTIIIWLIGFYFNAFIPLMEAG